MQTPLQITLLGMDPSEALESRIREKAVKLEEFHPRITRCRVSVEESRKHHTQGRHFSVRIDVHVPGREVVATRDHDEDVYVALRDAFDAVGRQLEEVVREMRGDVKVHAEPAHGTVTRLVTDEGYGFIESEDGRELYFSRENVVHPPFDDLTTGMAVHYLEEMGGEGPQAKRISAKRHRA